MGNDTPDLLSLNIPDDEPFDLLATMTEVAESATYEGWQTYEEYIDNASKKTILRQRLDPVGTRIYNRNYRKKNPYKAKVWGHRREARKRNLPDNFTAADWEYALDYWHNCCAVCSRPVGFWHTLAADHWTPLSSPECPGTVPWNMLPLCHGNDGCNNQKSDTNPIEWVIKKLGKRKGKAKLKEIEAYFKTVRKS